MMVLYRDTTLFLAGLWSSWGDGGYSHGFPVLLMCAYIVYADRNVLSRSQVCPSIYALPALALCVLFWVISGLVNIQILQSVILIPLTLTIIWALSGLNIMRRLIFPVLFVGLAMPVWFPLQPVLMEVTADGAYWLARIAGVPAYLDDFIIYIPSGRLSVEAACSGLHYLLAGLTLGIFYAYLNYRKLRHRLLVVALVSAASIFTNILRVFIITWLAYTTDMQHPYVRDHLALGWYLFSAVIFILLFVDFLVINHSENIGGELAAVKPPDSRCDTSRWLLITIITIILLSLGPVATSWARINMESVNERMLNLPDGKAGWTGPLDLADSWRPQYHGSVSRQVAYQKGEQTIYVYFAYYPTQQQGAELVNELNRLVNNDKWKIVGGNGIKLNSENNAVLEIELESMYDKNRLVWHRYRVAEHYTTSEMGAKLFQALGLLTGRTGAAIIAVATPIETDKVTARESLEDFINTMEAPLARVADGKH